MDLLLDIIAYAIFAIVLFGMGVLTYWLWMDDDLKAVEE